MNCQDICRILDEHRFETLAPDARGALDRHLASCAECADAVALQRLLLDEPVPAPREGLFPELLAWAAEESGNQHDTPSLRRWQTLGGLAAAAALIVVVAISSLGPEAEQRESAGSELRAEQFVEGVDFVSLPMASPLGNVGERISAWLFYLWSCLHCYELESFLSEWSASPEAESIDLIRIPVQWNPVAQLHAQAFFTAEALGIADEISAAFYRGIHERGTMIQTASEVENVFLGLGVEPAVFREAFESEQVQADLERAARLAGNLGIDATPTIIVDGIYRTDVGMAGSHERLMRIIEWLGTERCEGLRPSCPTADRF